MQRADACTMMFMFLSHYTTYAVYKVSLYGIGQERQINRS